MLGLGSKNLLVLITFIIDNLKRFQANAEVHSASISHKRDFHRPASDHSIKMESLLCWDRTVKQAHLQN
jgi:hypothetical protein